MKALLVNMNETPKVIDVEDAPSYQVYAEILGCEFVEHHALGQDIAIYIDETGRLKYYDDPEGTTQPNRALYTQDDRCFDVIFGNFIIVGTSEDGDDIGLKQWMTDELFKRLANPSTGKLEVDKDREKFAPSWSITTL